ncbi:MAG: segregation/condensation protein A [Parvularculaceae bacterium]|nr:segregation/condensation protein A [Parvularculaceae bacterium]
MSEEAMMAADEATSGEEPFDAPVRHAPPQEDVDALIVNLDVYEGPLHVLLDLARTQKVDLRKISMIRLVDQYLDFVAAARAKSLELAADYLVMASWLTYLKSKILIPTVDDGSGEPTADEMAARLAFQLQRLEAMRKASETLFNLPQFGLQFFPRGLPEGVRVLKTPLWQAELFELLQAYARQRVAAVDRTYKIEAPKVFTIEDARARIQRMLGAIPEWTELTKVSPSKGVDAPAASVVASSFNAALEFAKNGALEIRQLAHFEPIYVRQRRDAAVKPPEATSEMAPEPTPEPTAEPTEVSNGSN